MVRLHRCWCQKHSSPDGRIIKFQLVNKGRASVFGQNCCFHCTGHLLHSHTEECDGCSDCLTHTLPLTQVVGLKANRVKTRPGIVNLKFGGIFLKNNTFNTKFLIIFDFHLDI